MKRSKSVVTIASMREHYQEAQEVANNNWALLVAARSELAQAKGEIETLRKACQQTVEAFDAGRHGSDFNAAAGMCRAALASNASKGDK